MSRATIIDERPEEELETTDQLDTQDTVETPQEVTFRQNSQINQHLNNSNKKTKK